VSGWVCGDHERMMSNVGYLATALLAYQRTSVPGPVVRRKGAWDMRCDAVVMHGIEGKDVLLRERERERGGQRASNNK
jgi:hypothetical protein